MYIYIYIYNICDVRNHKLKQYKKVKTLNIPMNYFKFHM